MKKRGTLADLLSEGIPIVRGPTFEDICNIDIVSRQADAIEHRPQQDPRSADEWQSLLVFFRARRFSNKHPARGRTPRPKDNLAPCSMESTAPTPIGFSSEDSKIPQIRLQTTVPKMLLLI